MAGREAGPIATLTSTVYERLRREIVRGILRPGERLRIEVLRERYGVGGSPIREALNRLSAEGLVTQEDQKGFQVLPISLDELNELARTRCWLNEIVLRESIANGDAAWEENIVLALHRLSRVSSDPNAPDEEVIQREKLHRVFHRSLLAACESRWLLDFAEMLFDCADRYRFVTRVFLDGPEDPRDTKAEHQRIMEATIDRDTPAAVKLANEHILHTAETIARSGAAFLSDKAPQQNRLIAKIPGRTRSAPGGRAPPA
jgi:GntR family carbon starvation induced transcriptional regulator